MLSFVLYLKQISPSGQDVAQALYGLHKVSLYIILGPNVSPSGFAHHLQRMWQPLKNTIVLIPGPSYKLYFCTLKTLMRVSCFLLTASTIFS